MKIKKTTLVAILFVIGIVAAVFAVAQYNPNAAVAGAKTAATPSQLVKLIAKGGFFPNEVTATAGKEVTLRIVTKNTYDCSASLMISALKINTVLLPTAETDFIIPPQKAGTVITGSCSSGSSGFKITFL